MRIFFKKVLNKTKEEQIVLRFLLKKKSETEKKRILSFEVEFV